MSGKSVRTKDDKKKLRSRSQLFFYFFSVVIFIFVIYYFAEIKKDVKLFEKVNVYWLGAAVLGQVFTYFAGAIVYYKLLQIFVIRWPPDLWKLVQATIVAVPAGGIIGNSFFFNYLHKRNIRTPQILSLIFIELLAFYAVMEIVTIFAIAACLLLHKVRPFLFTVLAAGVLMYFLFAFFIGYIGRKGPLTSLYEKIMAVRFVKKFAAKLEEDFESKGSLKEMRNPSRLLKEHKSIVAKVLLYQLFIFLANSFTIFAIFYGLGVHASIVLVMIGLIATKIISILPILPGSLILYESSMTFFFVSLGLPFGSAITVTLLYRILSFWLPMIIGFFMYRKLQAETE